MFYFSATDRVVFQIIAILAFVFCISRLRAIRDRKRYPPGPPGYFLWGNFFDLTQAKAYKTCAEWSKTYGMLNDDLD